MKLRFCVVRFGERFGQWIGRESQRLSVMIPGVT